MPQSTTTPESAVQPSSSQSDPTRNGRSPAELLEAVKALTERHFPHGPVDVELEHDPEVPSDEFYLLSVTATGSPREIADQQRLCRREIHRLTGNLFDAFRVSVREIV